jgi:hypothetical protein
MRRSVASLALASLAACTPKAVTAPSPVTLTTPRAPAEVVQIVGRELTALGFEITHSDATGGSLTARKAGGREYLTCIWPKGSMGAGAARPVLSVFVAARPAAGGSAVTVRSSTHTTYDLPRTFQLPESDTDCASTGEVEQRTAGWIGAAR